MSTDGFASLRPSLIIVISKLNTTQSVLSAMKNKEDKKGISLDAIVITGIIVLSILVGFVISLFQ